MASIDKLKALPFTELYSIQRYYYSIRGQEEELERPGVNELAAKHIKLINEAIESKLEALITEKPAGGTTKITRIPSKKTRLG